MNCGFACDAGRSRRPAARAVAARRNRFHCLQKQMFLIANSEPHVPPRGHHKCFLQPLFSDLESD
jgi:hypothetical protein